MACTYFGAASSQVPDHSSTELYRFEEEEGKASHFVYNNSLMHGNESFLSFDQQTNHHPIQVHDPNSSSSTSNSQKLVQDFGCVQSTTSSYTYMKQNKQEEAIGWGDYKNGESCSNKRPHSGESMQALKKHCNNATKKSKAKSATTTTTTTPTKDPQSLAAKNRRERISERLKVLQELVPNGSKVDMVTMLEKAIGYVKFLQLQVKVLASDEFWPVQGGKAPDLSQVKNCIDAILSSQRDTTSSSK